MLSDCDILGAYTVGRHWEVFWTQTSKLLGGSVQRFCFFELFLKFDSESIIFVSSPSGARDRLKEF